MSEIKIIEWNIRGAASTGWSNGYEIKRSIVNEIMNKGAEIVILNEFVISIGWDYFQSKLMENDYVWFISCLSSKNGLFIAVKKELISGNLRNFTNNKLYDHKSGVVFNENSLVADVKPNFLHVKGDFLNIIGIRIRPTEDYKQRKDQLDAVLNYFMDKKLKKVIIAGDFNNSRIKGDKSKSYSQVSENYHWADSKKKISQFFV